MTAAIIITGHMRSFNLCLPNLWWFVFRHFPEAHVFVSTIKDQDSPKAGLLREKFKHVTIEEVDSQPDFPDLKPWQPDHFYSHEPYAISVPPAAVLRQLWQLEKGYDLFTLSGIAAEVIVRCRPDLWFHDSELESPFTMSPKAALLPNWGAFGGVNDRFAVLGQSAAAAYFTTFSQHQKFMAEGCPLHPESLVKASLARAGTHIMPSRFLFSTVRTSGEMRPPEIVASDFLK